MARKIAIAIHKGGVGKTTTAKNLAASFALKDKQVLLVDLDEQANTTKGLNIDPLQQPVNLSHLLADPDKEVHTAIVKTDIDNLYLLPAHSDLAKIETGMAVQRSDPLAPDPIFALKELIAPLDKVYDFILFDTPPSLNYMTINALAAADELLIPASASAYTEGGLNRTLEAYNRAKQTYNPSLGLPRILITRVKRTRASNNVLNGINEEYIKATIPQAIVESTAVDEAEQLAQPVVLYDPKNMAAQNYKRVAEILMNE